MSGEAAERAQAQRPKGRVAPKRKIRDTRDDTHVLPLPTGRPSKFSQTVARHIIEQMHMGRTLFDICDQDSIAPHRATVLRWAETQSAFASDLARARKALAIDAERRIVKAIESTAQNTANADRVKIQAWQWLAARRDPSVYADKAPGVDVTINLDTLVAGSYAVERKREAKQVEAKVTTKPLDVVAEKAKAERTPDAQS